MLDPADITSTQKTVSFSEQEALNYMTAHFTKAK